MFQAVSSSFLPIPSEVGLSPTAYRFQMVCMIQINHVHHIIRPKKWIWKCVLWTLPRNLWPDQVWWFGFLVLHCWINDAYLSTTAAGGGEVLEERCFCGLWSVCLPSGSVDSMILWAQCNAYHRGGAHKYLLNERMENSSVRGWGGPLNLSPNS